MPARVRLILEQDGLSQLALAGFEWFPDFGPLLGFPACFAKQVLKFLFSEKPFSSSLAPKLGSKPIQAAKP